jgi:Acetyltransferase (GNAT) domain
LSRERYGNAESSITVEPEIIDPLVDLRWADLTVRHPKASAFHSRGWLEALSRTYGYRPFAITNSRAGMPLQEGIVLCEVSSWLTGNRVVSLPFSDHCTPLVENQEALENLAEWLASEGERRHWKYIELRPQSWHADSASWFGPGDTYFLHKLDLAPSPQQLFHNLHKDSIQRKIRRAEREGVQCENGRSQALLDEFYGLLCRTRRRHRLVPQPRSWFRNLIDCIPEAVIRVARKNKIPVAAILCLGHWRSVIYKYGCSNEQFHPLGAMPLLFWKLIEESREAGAQEIDFGRSDADQHGLITFKDRLGCSKSKMTYYRCPKSDQTKVLGGKLQSMRRVIAITPDALLPIAGRLLYKHMG